MEKPKELYRGIKLNYDEFRTIKWYGVDIVPPHNPIIDSNGMKRSKEGGEYGVYMTDNYYMAYDKYSRPSVIHMIDAWSFFEDINNGLGNIVLPDIGIIYKINPANINIHEPFLASILKGARNDNYPGKEWIVDVVPASEYSILDIRIGADLLHNEEIIRVTNIDDDFKQVITIMERRRQQLNLLYSQLKKMQSIKTYYSLKDAEVLIYIFGDNGVIYNDYQNCELHTASDYIMYLMSQNYSMDSNTIDFETLSFIQSIAYELPENSSLADLFQILKDERKEIIIARENDITRAKNNNRRIDTSYYDSKIVMIDNIYEQLTNKVNSLEENGALSK